MQSEIQQTANGEISLKDLVAFLKRNKWRIVIAVFVGLLLSTTYVLLVPKKFEARWQLQMAQINNTNVNIEQPSALIQRLRMPTSYSQDVRTSCGVQEDGDANDYLDGKLKIEIIKNVSDSVEMKVVARSTIQAEKCAEAIVAMIVVKQENMILESLSGRQEQLERYLQAVREEQRQLEAIKKLDIGNFAYMAKLDKLSWLRTRIDSLQEEFLMSQKHPAKLVAPIYVPNKPVSPKVGMALLLGALLGLMFGVLYALGREGWRKAE